MLNELCRVDLVLVPLRAVAPTRHDAHEARHDFDHRVRLIALRRVAAIRKLPRLNVARAMLDASELLHRAVFIVLTLNAEDRAGNARQKFLDVPRAKRGIEPY